MLALLFQGLDCNLHPCPKGDSAAKPDWLKQEFEGKMPCLDDGGKRVVSSLFNMRTTTWTGYLFIFFFCQVESSTICEYLENTYPDPPLLNGLDEAVVVDAQNAAKDIFPAMAKLVKCHERDHYVEKNLLRAAAAFHEFWTNKKKAEGLYLSKPPTPISKQSPIS